MQTDERREKVLEVVRQKGFASLVDLVQEFSVSESTIRRDLEHLEGVGAARRTHGGVFYTGPSPKLPHFDMRQTANWDRKRVIARKASQLICDGETLLLDGGSTTYELARLLVSRSLQIVTNSLPVANLFTGSESVDVILTGGNVHTRTGVLLGPYATAMLKNIHVQRAVLSVSGVHDDGFYNNHLLLVETEQAMMAAAEQTMIVADSTKFGQKGLARLCGLPDVQALVVDGGLTEDWRAKAAAAKVPLVVADAGA